MFTALTMQATSLQRVVVDRQVRLVLRGRQVRPERQVHRAQQAQQALTVPRAWCRDRLVQTGRPDPRDRPALRPLCRAESWA